MNHVIFGTQNRIVFTGLYPDKVIARIVYEPPPPAPFRLTLRDILGREVHEISQPDLDKALWTYGADLADSRNADVYIEPALHGDMYILRVIS